MLNRVLLRRVWQSVREREPITLHSRTPAGSDAFVDYPLPGNSGKHLQVRHFESSPTGLIVEVVETVWLTWKYFLDRARPAAPHPKKDDWIIDKHNNKFVITSVTILNYGNTFEMKTKHVV